MPRTKKGDQNNPFIRLQTDDCSDRPIVKNLFTKEEDQFLHHRPR